MSAFEAGRTHSPNRYNDYHGKGTGFFKPPMDGYYSFINTQCDDVCELKVSLSEPNKGCPASLNYMASRIGYGKDLA